MKNYTISEMDGRNLILVEETDGRTELILCTLEGCDKTLFMMHGNEKTRVTLKRIKELITNGVAFLSKVNEPGVDFYNRITEKLEDKNRQLKLELETKEEPTPEPTSTEIEPTISNSLIISKGINEKLGNPTLEIKFDKFVSRTLFKLMFDTVREMYPSASYFALKKCVCIQDKGGDKHIDLDVAMEKIKGIKLA